MVFGIPLVCTCGGRLIKLSQHVVLQAEGYFDLLLYDCDTNDSKQFCFCCNLVSDILEICLCFKDAPTEVRRNEERPRPLEKNNYRVAKSRQLVNKFVFGWLHF